MRERALLITLLGDGALDSRIWDELLEEFRALGGIADNVRLGHGAFGRGLFAENPAEPVLMKVPENLLLNVADVVFENNVLKISPGASCGTRERKFLEDYFAHLSWGEGGREEIEQILAAAQALPDDLRHLLKSEYRCGNWFSDYSPALVQQQFVNARHIAFKNRFVLMPVLDLANFGPGRSFSIGDAISFQGQVQDEVLVRYADTDTYGAFVSWGFAAEQPQALSIALSLTVGNIALEIGREFDVFTPGAQPWVPTLSNSAGRMRLNFLMLGNSQTPRRCKGIFNKLMRDGHVPGYEELFDLVQHLNRKHFLELLTALEGAKGPMVHTLRRMARLQLQALSHCYGVRES